MRRAALIFLMVCLLPSCGHVISQESRALASLDVAFPELQQNLGKYVNNVFVLGGFIAETAISREGTELEIVQTPVDRFGSIIDPDTSEGRFIITTPRQLDPFIYRKNRAITFAGRLTGSKKKMLGEAEYDYPVFEAKEIYLWRDNRYYIYPYYPYPYYWYDLYPLSWYYPYRYRPFVYP